MNRPDLTCGRCCAHHIVLLLSPRRVMYARMNTKLLAAPTDPTAWEQAMYAFLAEKHRRSESRRTVESYSRMLNDFFGRVHKTPDQVTCPEVLSWAHGVGLSGRQP